ncbi:MAG TPA: ATP-dependent helicase [Syntrophobacteraceae bacterium]|nr:ATP-dependent helicase [Syntrophobacteraceae bacterium]
MIQLSEVQKQAVEYMGKPTLVTAGAGSGKTRVLTAKFAYLIRIGYDPARILAITFTNKAANEMKDRLERLTGLKSFQFPWVRTFHSACLRILKEHCLRAGYRHPLYVCSTYHQEKHIKALLVENFNLDPKKYLHPVAAAISRAKNSGRPRQYLEGIRVDRRIQKSLPDIYAEYNRRLKGANSVDFDDILLRTRDLLDQHEDLRRRYADHFQYVMVDEYQDVNDLQEEITRLVLKDGNLFVVGDDYQAIYGFRGANVGNFLDFRQRHADAVIFKLEENHRSTREVVETAELLIRKNRQIPKKCFSRKTGGSVEVAALENEFAEADRVVDLIRHHHRSGIPYQAMSILYRSNAISLPFEQELRANGVPYMLKGDKGFFERKEILDINCYLAAAANPRDNVSLDRILNVPKRGIGSSAYRKILDLKHTDMSLRDACREAVRRMVLPTKVLLGLERLLDFLESIGKEKPEKAIGRVLSEAGYETYLAEYCKGENTREFQNRMENIQFLLYAASQKQDLVEYLEEITLDGSDEKEEKDESKSGVTLSTVHGAKGLEWEVVFVVGLEEDLFPHWRALAQDSADGIQEERRLAYVAFTRAIRHLHLSWVGVRKGQSRNPSVFLKEAGLL